MEAYDDDDLVREKEQRRADIRREKMEIFRQVERLRAEEEALGPIAPRRTDTSPPSPITSLPGGLSTPGHPRSVASSPAGSRLPEPTSSPEFSLRSAPAPSQLPIREAGREAEPQRSYGTDAADPHTPHRIEVQERRADGTISTSFLVNVAPPNSPTPIYMNISTPAERPAERPASRVHEWSDQAVGKATGTAGDALVKAWLQRNKKDCDPDTFVRLLLDAAVTALDRRTDLLTPERKRSLLLDCAMKVPAYHDWAMQKRDARSREFDRPNARAFEDMDWRQLRQDFVSCHPETDLALRREALNDLRCIRQTGKVAAYLTAFKEALNRAERLNGAVPDFLNENGVGQLFYLGLNPLLANAWDNEKRMDIAANEHSYGTVNLDRPAQIQQLISLETTLDALRPQPPPGRAPGSTSTDKGDKDKEKAGTKAKEKEQAKADTKDAPATGSKAQQRFLLDRRPQHLPQLRHISTPHQRVQGRAGGRTQEEAGGRMGEGADRSRRPPEAGEARLCCARHHAQGPPPVTPDGKRGGREPLEASAPAHSPVPPSASVNATLATTPAQCESGVQAASTNSSTAPSPPCPLHLYLPLSSVSGDAPDAASATQIFIAHTTMQQRPTLEMHQGPQGPTLPTCGVWIYGDSGIGADHALLDCSANLALCSMNIMPHTHPMRATAASFDRLGEIDPLAKTVITLSTLMPGVPLLRARPMRVCVAFGDQPAKKVLVHVVEDLRGWDIIVGHDWIREFNLIYEPKTETISIDHKEVILCPTTFVGGYKIPSEKLKPDQPHIYPAYMAHDQVLRGYSGAQLAVTVPEWRAASEVEEGDLLMLKDFQQKTGSHILIPPQAHTARAIFYANVILPSEYDAVLMQEGAMVGYVDCRPKCERFSSLLIHSAAKTLGSQALQPLVAGVLAEKWSDQSAEYDYRLDAPSPTDIDKIDLSDVPEEIRPDLLKILKDYVLAGTSATRLQHHARRGHQHVSLRGALQPHRAHASARLAHAAAPAPIADQSDYLHRLLERSAELADRVRNDDIAAKARNKEEYDR